MALKNSIICMRQRGELRVLETFLVAYLLILQGTEHTNSVTDGYVNNLYLPQRRLGASIMTMLV